MDQRCVTSAYLALLGSFPNPGILPSSPCASALLFLAGYPLLDNILVPTAAGTSRISSTFSTVASRAFILTVRDTYRPTWPSATPLSDTSARVDANMSDAQMLVTYLMVPSAQLDLLASPPLMPSLSDVQAGVHQLQL